LREITTRVFEVDKNHLRTFDGNFEHYLRKKQEELVAKGPAK
jgi:ATP-binding cassette subfamily F protein 3